MEKRLAQQQSSIIGTVRQNDLQNVWFHSGFLRESGPLCSPPDNELHSSYNNSLAGINQQFEKGQKYKFSSYYYKICCLENDFKPVTMSGGCKTCPSQEFEL